MPGMVGSIEIWSGPGAISCCDQELDGRTLMAFPVSNSDKNSGRSTDTVTSFMRTQVYSLCAVATAMTICTYALWCGRGKPEGAIPLAPWLSRSATGNSPDQRFRVSARFPWYARTAATDGQSLHLSIFCPNRKARSPQAKKAAVFRANIACSALALSMLV
jgi:hypothetical protein